MLKAGEKGDLPGFSQSARSIVNALDSDADSDAELVKAVLTDAGLTQRVLRLANSSMYNVFAGEVTSVTRAVQVLGVQPVAHLALGLKVMESMGRSRPSSAATLAEMQKSVLAGFMGRQLAGGSASTKESEAAALCAMLMGLGRMLVCFYLPESWDRIQVKAIGSASEQDAAVTELGGSFADIAQLMTRRWGLPPSLTNCLQARVPENGNGPATHEERLGMLATAATECARVLHAQPEDHDDAVSAVVGVFAAPLGLDALAMGEAIRSASNAAQEHFAAQPTALVQPVSEGDRQDRLLRGFRRLQEAALTSSPTRLPSLALEYLHEHFHASRSFFFLGSQKVYSARAGLGSGATALLPALHFEIQQRPDVFNAVLGSGKVLFVEDAGSASLRDKLPSWWLDNLNNAQGFCVVPIKLDNHALGLLYLDWVAPVAAPRMDIVRTRTLGQVSDLLVSRFAKERG
jgi:HD-like signal output (HDOD) protein